MTDERIEQLEWLPELVRMVRHEMARRQEQDVRDGPALEAERDALSQKIKGWTESLGKTDLPPKLRVTIERETAAALARVEELELRLEESDAQETQAEQILDENEVLHCLARLEDMLARECRTLGNLMVSLHIDRIVSHKDGRVVMRVCKLGSCLGALDLLVDRDHVEGEQAADKQPPGYRPKPRRRGRVRIDSGENLDFDLEAAANMAADPNRFAGLPDEWFWIDEFRIPGKSISWAAANAEPVFRRRQEARLSFAKLGEEFGVTAPTAKAAVKHYLAEHPEARDEVDLPRGGQRPPRFDLSKFGREARALWEDGWSKLQLAEKYGCSAPTIDKALAWAYAQDGLAMPTRGDRKQLQIARARAMLDEDRSLDEIAETLKVSDVTARAYLRESFAAEGKAMPDLRSERRRPR